MGDHLDARVGVDVIVERALLALQHVVSRPSKEELIGIVHGLRKECLGQHATPEESAREEGLPAEDPVHYLGLQIDHGVHNLMIETTNSSSRSQSDEQVDLLGQINVAGEGAEALRRALREANVAQFLTARYLQRILDARGYIVGNEIVDAKVPVFLLIGAILAMFVRVRISTIVAEPHVESV